MIVDAHHHFWDPARAEYPWMTDEVTAIRRAFGPPTSSRCYATRA
jgi:L-fucono-1,5-lactonase